MQSDAQKNNGNSKSQIINNDLRSLKDDAVTLSRDIKDYGGSAVRESLHQLRKTGEHEFQRVEKYVKEKPGQSILLAFGVGLIASYVLGARR